MQTLVHKLALWQINLMLHIVISYVLKSSVNLIEYSICHQIIDIFFITALHTYVCMYVCMYRKQWFRVSVLKGLKQITIP